MLCSRCGHDNPEQNRYCAMCGVRLEKPSAKPAEAATPEKVAPAAGAPARASILGLDSEPPPPRPSGPRPSITGPSILGLGTEPEPAGVNYLLEDDEPRRHFGLWITLVLLVAVVLAGRHFRAELRPLAGPLYAAVLARVNPQPPAPAAPAVPAAAPALSDPTAAAPQPSATGVANDATPAAGATQEVQTAASPTPPPKPEDKSVSAVSEESVEPAKPSPDTGEDAASKKNTGKAAKYTHASRQRPAEAVAPEDNPLLQLAQKYIRGQGVHQDCAIGLAYLREAMKRPSAAAASQMGALYATGTCVPLDRLAAYRYFSSALQMAPNNAWLAQERDGLYGQMSSAERRQADRQ